MYNLYLKCDFRISDNRTEGIKEMIRFSSNFPKRFPVSVHNVFIYDKIEFSFINVWSFQLLNRSFLEASL